jgi:hypothetical protein
MNIQSPLLFEAPLAHEVGVHTGYCNCRECRSNSAREFERGWAEREWEAVVGPNPRVNTPLPRSGPGFVSSKPMRQQFGLPETIQALQAIGVAWQQAHPDGPRIGIRDISFQGGGPMPGHRSHQRGIDVDIRPVRNDGQEGATTFRSSTYSQSLTQELVNFIRANGILRVQFIFFNDPSIRGVQPFPNHDDHLHVRFFPPDVPPIPPPSRQRPVLRRGSRGPAVQELQTRLNVWRKRWSRFGLGLQPLVVDGIFGPLTQGAVRAYQRAQGLVADGVVGPHTWGRLLQLPPSPAPSPPSTVPPPIKRESQPPDSTLYVNIVLGGESPAQPMTGIFIPKNYHLQPRVDMILYLHGYHREQPNLSIDGYWQTLPLRAFRERVNDSQKNVILVSPTLGPRSQAGWLAQPGGLDRYLDQILAALTMYGPYQGLSPTLGNIILSAHSGGGSPMTSIVLANQRYTSFIRECWAFDSMYGGSSAWADWAVKNPQARLYNYYRQTRDKDGRPNNTWPPSEALQRRNLPNVITTALLPSTIAHDQVPIQYWRTRINGASFLTDK